MSCAKLPAILADYVEPMREEGVTFTANPAAVLWPVRIASPHARPMTCTIRATSADQAQSFAAKRHPYATSILVGEPQDMMKPLREFIPLDEAKLEQAQKLHDDGMSWREVCDAMAIPAGISHHALKKRCGSLIARRNDPNKPAPKPAAAPAKAAAPRPEAPPSAAISPALPTVLDALGKALQDAAALLRQG